MVNRVKQWRRTYNIYVIHVPWPREMRKTWRSWPRNRWLSNLLDKICRHPCRRGSPRTSSFPSTPSPPWWSLLVPLRTCTRSGSARLSATGQWDHKDRRCNTKPMPDWLIVYSYDHIESTRIEQETTHTDDQIRVLLFTKRGSNVLDICILNQWINYFSFTLFSRYQHILQF